MFYFGCRFLKEEPAKIEEALKRCKKLTGTLYTLKRSVNFIFCTSIWGKHFYWIILFFRTSSPAFHCFFHISNVFHVQYLKF